MEFRWNSEKDDWLKKYRGLGFEDVVFAYKEGKLLAITPHPKRHHQMLIVFEKDNYIFVAPCVMESENIYFLKTIYPSRKATKRFLSV